MGENGRGSIPCLLANDLDAPWRFDTIKGKHDVRVPERMPSGPHILGDTHLLECGLDPTIDGLGRYVEQTLVFPRMSTRDFVMMFKVVGDHIGCLGIDDTGRGHVKLA